MAPSHYTVREFLAPSLLKQLTTHVLGNHMLFTSIADERQHNSSEMGELGTVKEILTDTIRKAGPDIAWRLGLTSFSRIHTEMKMVSIGNAGFQAPRRDNEPPSMRLISFICFCHKEPQAFRGGELCIHADDGKHKCIIEPVQNSATFFLSSTPYEILQVSGASRQPNSSYLILNGWLHHTE